MDKEYLKDNDLKTALDELTEEYWRKVVYALLIRTEKLIRSRFASLSHILSAEDLVNEAIVRLYEKTSTETSRRGRSWDGDINSLYHVLFHTIRSIIDQEVKRHNKQSLVFYKYFEKMGVNFQGTHNTSYYFIGQRILKIVQKDPVLSIIIKNIFELPSLELFEVSAFYNYNKNQMNNALRRLKRKLSAYNISLKHLFEATDDAEKKAVCKEYFNQHKVD